MYDALNIAAEILPPAIAAFVLTVFMILYARLPWQKSPTGRSIMVMKAALLTLALMSVGRRLDEVFLRHDFATEFSFLFGIAWVLVTSVMVWRILLVQKDVKHRDEEELCD